MEWVTRHAVITCGHDARVGVAASQDWVRAVGAPVLVGDDPVGRPIAGCPNAGPTIKPCTSTLRVAAGHSTWIRVGGHPVVLSTLDGLTDGTVPGTVHYRVVAPGQHLVRADA
jgi:hypothetical protein